MKQAVYHQRRLTQTDQRFMRLSSDLELGDKEGVIGRFFRLARLTVNPGIY